MDGRSNSYLFTSITTFNYNRPVKWNIQIINCIKAPATVFVIFIVKNPKTIYYTTLVIILYAKKVTK